MFEQQDTKILSSNLTRVLTLDWLTPRILAARGKFRYSATIKVRINNANGMREPRGERIPFLYEGLVSLIRWEEGWYIDLQPMAHQGRALSALK